LFYKRLAMERRMKVSQAGQVTIPPDLQEESGIYPGDEVDVRLENGAIVVRRSETSERIREFLRHIDEARRSHRESRRQNTGSIDGLEGLGRGEQFVRLLAEPEKAG
jgi:AbrB family looped-hinge helix DNA binding protein